MLSRAVSSKLHHSTRLASSVCHPPFFQRGLAQGPALPSNTTEECAASLHVLLLSWGRCLKKYCHDHVFHTTMPALPFLIISTENCHFTNKQKHLEATFVIFLASFKTKQLLEAGSPNSFGATLGSHHYSHAFSCASRMYINH